MVRYSIATSKHNHPTQPFFSRLAALILVAFTASASAETPQDTTLELEEVIVTAQKREQRAMDVPMSVSVVGGQVIEDLDISNALDLSYLVPGMVVQEAVPGTQLYTLRGIGNAAGSSNLVGVYLDEADVTSADINGQYDLSLYDLERVEVLRGPQGTLYGAGSVGGTIRLITNKPRLDQPGGKAEISAFSQARGDASYEARAALNIPLVQDVFALRFVLNYHDWGGWIDQPAADRENINDNKYTDARLRALWRINDRFDINGTLIVHRNEGGGMNIVNLPPYSKSLVQTFIDPALETPYEDDYDHYNLTATYDFDSATLVSATAYTDSWRYRASSRRFVFASDLIPDFPGSDVYEAYGSSGSSSNLFTQELRLVSGGEKAFNWVVGLFYRDEDESGDDLKTTALGGMVLGSDVPYSWATHNESWAVFGEASLALSERWELGVGARYFNEDRFRADLMDWAGQKANFDDFSPRAFLAFSAAENINIYVNFARGFRSGGFNGAEVENAGGPGSYGPENLDSYELGTKMTLADGRLYTELVLFYSEYKNMQTIGVVPGTLFSVISNIGEAEIQGFEWTVQWRPSDRLNLGFNGSVIDTEVTAVNAENTPQLPGDPLDQVAEYAWSLYVDYLFNWSASNPGFFRTGYNRQGPTRMTDRSLGLVNPFGISDTLGFLYASIGVRFGRTTLELFGRNLLDEDGRSNPYDIGYIETQPRPRMIGVRLAFNYE